jgi:GTP 3',8-cyclase
MSSLESGAPARKSSAWARLDWAAPLRHPCNERHMSEQPPPRSRPADRPAPAEHPARDTRGRALRDLRISVTDRCNFRCHYCMPKEIFGARFPFLERAELLSFGEIHRLVRLFRDHGVQKIRLTGGEPLLRRRLERLVEMLAYWDDLDLTLTTNGSLLKEQAQTLRSAGLRRITVSLDALDDATFKRMNDVNFPVAAVLAGIDAAEAAGLAPIKVNMVVQRGVNEESVLPMARFFKARGHILRFIEYMDVGATNGWSLDQVVPSRELAQRIHQELPIEPLTAQYQGEVAERWRYTDGSGEIGFISSVTQAFCSGCTRARLSAEGRLYTCLFASSGTDLRAPIRNGAADAEVAALIRSVWNARDDRYSELRAAGVTSADKIEMSYIGG